MRNQALNCDGWFCLLLISLGLASAAPPFGLISSPPAGVGVTTGGNGDSFAPILSPDGRYVVFASTADNLVTATNGTANVFPLKLNVFLRDRTEGRTTLASANAAGTGGNGGSVPADISTNGRYVAFQSNATDLTPTDTNNTSDIFVRDVLTASHLLVSVGTNGYSANGASRSAVMTPDGRFVAFVSEASDLVTDDTNGMADVFVRDMTLGSNMLVSAGAVSAGSVLKYATSSSESPAISSDGRYVCFFSTATNLIPGASTIGDIYVRDLASGVTWCASDQARAALKMAVGTTNGICFNHALSADGQFVAFQVGRAPEAGAASPGLIVRFSLGTGSIDIVHTNAFVPPMPYEDIHNLDLTPDGRFIAFLANTNGTSGATTCVYVWDAETGATVLASGNLSNAVPVNSKCDQPALSADGRFVAFLSSSTNMVTNALTGDFHIYRRDLLNAETVLLNGDFEGIGSPINPETTLALSADGQIAAFECAEGRLVSNNREQRSNVFIRDLLTGAGEVVSTPAPGLNPSTPNGPSFLSLFSLSADGRYIAYASEADNLVSNDTNRCRDIFARDVASGTNILISVAANDSAANGISLDPAISGNGRVVAFTSAANNLVAGDTNKASDVFVRFLDTGTTVLASINKTGSGPGNKASYSPSVSSDGRYVLFLSKATDLTAGSFGGAENLFLRDVPLGTNYALTTSGVFSASMTPEGRWICFAGTGGLLYRWDTLLSIRTTLLTLTGSGLDRVALSPDGNRVVYSSRVGLFLRDLAANNTTSMGPALSGSHLGLRFSQDGRWFVYARLVNAAYQVYLYDCQNKTNLLVSRSYAGAESASGHSDWPEISPDGRFIVYRSAATNLLSGHTEAIPRLIWYDRETGVNTLLGTAPANRSLCPVFSADGQTFAFQSWASDFTGHDFNQASDAFVLVFPRLSIAPADRSQPGLWLSWPYFPNTQYRVQFKDELDETNWSDLEGGVTNANGRAYFRDAAPVSARRFYRLESF